VSALHEHCSTQATRYWVLGTRNSRLVDHSLISDLQPAVDDGKRLAQLLLVDCAAFVFLSS
jgi:hypothetical protein